MMNHSNVTTADLDLTKLDLIDREGFENWCQNYINNSPNQVLKRTEKQSKDMMDRLLGIYKIYGTKNSAMVNPSGNRLKLQIRERESEV